MQLARAANRSDHGDAGCEMTHHPPQFILFNWHSKLLRARMLSNTRQPQKLKRGGPRCTALLSQSVPSRAIARYHFLPTEINIVEIKRRQRSIIRANPHAHRRRDEYRVIATDVAVDHARFQSDHREFQPRHLEAIGDSSNSIPSRLSVAPRARRIEVIFEFLAAASRPRSSRIRPCAADHRVAEMRIIDRRREHHRVARDLRDPRRRHPVASPILVRTVRTYIPVVRPAIARARLLSIEQCSRED